MRGVHPLSDGGVVATLQGVADVEHTPFLADHEACTAVVFVGDLIADRIEPLHRGAAQKLLSQHLRHALARLAPAVVGRADQFVLDDRIEQHELVTDGIEGKYSNSIERQSSRIRQPFLPKTEANWSMMPHFTPQ